MNKKMAMLCILGGSLVYDASALLSQRTFNSSTQDNSTAVSQVDDLFADTVKIALSVRPKRKLINRSRDLGFIESAPQMSFEFLVDGSDADTDAIGLTSIKPLSTIDHSMIVNKKNMFVENQGVELFFGTILTLSNCIRTGDNCVGQAIIRALIDEMLQNRIEKEKISAMSFSNFYKYMKKRTMDDASKNSVDIHNFLESLDLSVKYTKFRKLKDSYEAVQLSPISEEEERIFKMSRFRYSLGKLTGITSGCIGSVGE